MRPFSYNSKGKKSFMVVLISLILTFYSFMFIFNDDDIQSTAMNFGYNTDLDSANCFFQGEISRDEAGRSVSFAPDINGDGIDDILIGAELYDSDSNNASTGKTYVFFGSSIPWELNKNVGEAPISFIGEQQFDRAGVVTPAGDVNGDGLCDILIGAPYNDQGGGFQWSMYDGAGKIYLILGKTSGYDQNVILDTADASFIGEDINDNVGYHISTAGDVNGDGFDDFLIGTQYKDQTANDAGKVYLFFGKSSGWQPNTDLATADCSFIGDNENDRLHTVSGAGDVNQDGFDDILIGAPDNDGGGTNAGKVYLIFGKAFGWQKNITVSSVSGVSFIGEKDNDRLSKVAGVRDVNNDGCDDILLGSPYNNDGGNDAGKVYLIYGKKDSWTSNFNVVNADASFIGENPEDLAADIAGAGDVNGDGYNDFIIASRFNDKGGTNSGQLYLFLGKSDGLGSGIGLNNADASFVSNINDGMVDSFNGRYQPGDVNNDGYDDLIIGEPDYDASADYDWGRCNLFFLEINKRPNSITELRTYSDPEFSQTMNHVGLDESIYIEVIGEDQDKLRRNLAEVIVSSNAYDPFGICIPLMETENSSGIFRGFVQVKDKTHLSHQWIGANDPDEIFINSVENPQLTKHIPVGPRIKIEELQLINGDGPEGKTVYCGQNPYTLKVVVNDTLGCGDLESVVLSWQVTYFNTELKEQSKQTITLAWFQNNGSFAIIENSKGWLSFEEPSVDRDDENNIFELYFKMLFHWAYPENITTEIFILSTSKVLNNQWINFSKPDTQMFFRTINQVQLIGELDVSGEIQGELKEGDKVLADEELTWTGLKAVFIDNANPETVYPSTGSLKARITDSHSGIWEEEINQGENISIVTIAPFVDINILIDVNYRVSLVDLPETCDQTDIIFNIEVTSDIPYPPSSFVLHADSYDDDNNYADNDNNLYLTWWEPTNHLWEIDGYYYSFENNEFTTNGVWTKDTRGVISLSEDFSEVDDYGRVKVYVWARDIYGSIGYASSASIMIDTQPLEFNVIKPDGDSYLSTTEVMISLMITDKNGSGVESESISYRKSTTGPDGFGPWISYGESIDGTMIQCKLVTVFEPGDDNYIQWRAMDLAGNGFTLSDSINIKIDTGIVNTPPTASLLSPENDTMVTSDTPVLYWVGTDPDRDTVSFDIYFSTDYDKVAMRDNSVLIAMNFPDSSFQFSMPLENGETYYWTVIPNDELFVGTCLMDVWCFHIDISLRTSAVTLLLPHDNSIVSSLKPTLMWTLDYDGLNPATMSFDVYLDTNPNPTKIVSANQLENSFKPVLPLKNSETYYWKVIPYANDIKGICVSGVWQFEIDLNFSYSIELNSQYTHLTLANGDFKNIELFITNKGNQPDTIKLMIQSEDLEDITFNSTEIYLPRNDRGLATLYIHIPESVEEGTYTFTLIAVSEGAKIQGQSVYDEVTITVDVEKSQEDLEKEEMMSLISYLAIFIIILNIIIGFAALTIRRNRREKEKYRTLYYILKYSKPESKLKNQLATQQLKISKTVPLKEAILLEQMFDTKGSDLKESRYTLDERLAILKYHRSINKISDSQYKQGLVNLKKSIKVKKPVEGNNQESQQGKGVKE